MASMLCWYTLHVFSTKDVPKISPKPYILLPSRSSYTNRHAVQLDVIIGLKLAIHADGAATLACLHIPQQSAVVSAGGPHGRVRVKATD